MQLDILSRRKYYRERRNTVRKFFFFFFFISFVFFICLVLKIPDKKLINIELRGNQLIKNEYILQRVYNQLNGKNFFFVSPRAIAKNLVLSCGLLKDVVIRKYLLPEFKFIVTVKEKQLWGKLIFNKENSYLYVTHEGSLVNKNYINFNLLPVNLIPVFSESTNLLSESDLLILKDILDFFNIKLKIRINKFLVTDKNTLEIYTDNAIKINAGYIEVNLLNKIMKLTDILKQIQKKSYLVQYIDLSLENGAVIKKISEKEQEKKKKSLKLFMILH